MAPLLWWAPELVKKYFGDSRDGTGSNGMQTYSDYNMKQQGKGMFWHGVVNPQRQEDYEEADSGHRCDDPLRWIPNGRQADSPDALTPEKLAAYAYDSARVPSTAFHMDPAAGVKQRVNLPTWVWQDGARFRPTVVRGELDVPGAPHMWAETTAEPVGPHLDPGTADATVHPASGTCPVHKDGTVGRPRPKGHEGTPPCGVTYAHASTDGPYTLKATVTWKITWHGSGGTGGAFPDGTFGTSRDIRVGEVQSVVTGTR